MPVQSHDAFIHQNWMMLAALAWRGYLQEGRGAVWLDERWLDAPNPSGCALVLLARALKLSFRTQKTAQEIAETMPRYISAASVQAFTQTLSDPASRQSYATIAAEIAAYDPEAQVIVIIASGRSGGTINVQTAPNRELSPPAMYAAQEASAR
jgi:hypothetical protein